MTFRRDVVYALRSLRKDPGFSILAILALALGIGAVTTIFSVIENVLLDPFPYADSQRYMTVSIHDLTRSGPGGRGGYVLPEFLDYIEQNHVFDRVMGASQLDVLYRRNGGTEQFIGADTTPNTFDFLGVRPLLGRTVTADDLKPGAPPVFVMSYKMWTHAFHNDPTIVGTTLTLNDEPRTLIGIMPPRFTWYGADLWLIADMNRNSPMAKSTFFWMVGHLKHGVTESQAAADLNILAHRFAPRYPDFYPKRFNVEITPLADSVVGQFRNVLMILMAAVGMLLLIACVNVANMLLARATAREKEIAIRASMGANRLQLMRQFLAESLVLAVCGAAAGCLVAWAGIKTLVPLLPEHTIPDEAVIRLNPQVLLFALAVGVVTVLIFGLTPAVHGTRGRLAEALKDTGKGVSGGFRHGKLRGALVVAEIALSLVLLVSAGLLIRSFFAVESINLGIDPTRILIARLPLPAGQYKTSRDLYRFYSQVLSRLESTPGVLAASETSSLPLYGGFTAELVIPGQSSLEKPRAIMQLVSENYLDVLQLRPVRGRSLTAVDIADHRHVAVVNQTLVRKLFPNEDPIGRSITAPNLATLPDPVQDPTFEIVGVFPDAKNQGIQDPPMPELLTPYTITGTGQRGILVRTSDPDRMLNIVRKQIWAVDSNVALAENGSLETFLQRISYQGPKFGLMLLSVFAGVGLVLAAIGIYSVISYTVSRQTHEIGIRMAVGASAGNVMKLIFSMGFKLMSIGLILGLAVSSAATLVLQSQLYGISRFDPVTLAVVIPTLVIVVAAACFFPARQAIRVDPVIALRQQ